MVHKMGCWVPYMLRAVGISSIGWHMLHRSASSLAGQKFPIKFLVPALSPDIHSQWTTVQHAHNVNVDLLPLTAAVAKYTQSVQRTSSGGFVACLGKTGSSSYAMAI